MTRALLTSVLSSPCYCYLWERLLLSIWSLLVPLCCVALCGENLGFQCNLHWHHSSQQECWWALLQLLAFESLHSPLSLCWCWRGWATICFCGVWLRYCSDCQNIFFLGSLTLSTRLFLGIFSPYDCRYFNVSRFCSSKSGLYEAKKKPTNFTTMLFLEFEFHLSNKILILGN